MSGRLYVEVHSGHGPHALFVHGMLSSRAQWLANLSALSQVCRPVVVELLGHGRSPTPPDPRCYEPDRYVAAFEEVRVDLGVEQWFVVGQSLGAALTLRYALDHPHRLLAQVFTNSRSALGDDEWVASIGPKVEADALEMERLGRAALDAHPLHPARGRHLPADARAALAADVALHDPLGVARTLRHTIPVSSVRHRVASNTVPSLLVVGRHEQDFAEPRRYVEATMAHLEVVEANAGHAVNLGDAPAFNAAVRAFFERLTPAAH